MVGFLAASPGKSNPIGTRPLCKCSPPTGSLALYLALERVAFCRVPERGRKTPSCFGIGDGESQLETPYICNARRGDRRPFPIRYWGLSFDFSGGLAALLSSFCLSARGLPV